MYQQIIFETTIPDDLLYAIRNAIQDQQSALDWVAHRVDQKYGKNADRSPYFPLHETHDEFTKVFTKHFGLVETARSDIRDAFERHQPYQPSHEVLGHLHTLARVNKHQDFTAQERKEANFYALVANGQILLSGGSFNPGAQNGPAVHEFNLGGLPADLDGQRVALKVTSGSPERAATLRGIVIDWYFADPYLPVLATLNELQQAVTDTDADIGQVAAL